MHRVEFSHGQEFFLQAHTFLGTLGAFSDVLGLPALLLLLNPTFDVVPRDYYDNRVPAALVTETAAAAATAATATRPAMVHFPEKGI